KFDGDYWVFGGGNYWDSVVDETRKVQTTVSKASQGCEERLNEGLDETEEERCLFTPEVKESKNQQEMDSTILEGKVTEVKDCQGFHYTVYLVF
ncbi:unnamed protein product, partial [Albugo candida]